MFNKFKKGQRVYITGIGKNEDKHYNNIIGKIVEKDSYFCDYLVKISDKKSDWFDEKYLKPIRKYKKRRN